MYYLTDQGPSAMFDIEPKCLMNMTEKKMHLIFAGSWWVSGTAILCDIDAALLVEAT